MLIRSPRRAAALVLLMVTSLVVPFHAPAHAAVPTPGAGTSLPLGLDFSTALTGVITDKNHKVVHSVSLNVGRTSGDKTVQLTIVVANGTGLSGGSYTFGVPASDLVVGRGSASLDTHHDLGKYGHLSVNWTYTSHATTVTNPPNPCYSMGAPTTITRVVASATAQLNLTIPCTGVVDVTLSGTNLDIDSGQGLYAPTSSQTPSQSIYYTMVSGNKTLSSSQLDVSGMKTGTMSLLIVDLSTDSMATTGLIRSSQYASDTLPPAGLSAVTAAGKTTGTLTYRGVLGSAHLVVTGGGQSMSMSRSVRCLNPNASKADLGKTVSMQITQGTVSGSVSLTVACSAETKTFGAGDKGSVMVIGPASGGGATANTTPVAGATPPPGVTPPTTSGSLPGAINIGNFPAITAISPAPGSPLPATGTITVTFASALPAGAQIHMILLPSGGSGGMPVQLPNPVVSGSTATVTISTALSAGTYKLMVTATNGSGGSSIYQGTYTVS